MKRKNNKSADFTPEWREKISKALSRKITLTCKYCEEKYKVSPYRKDISKYCCKKCHSLDMIGKKGAKWNKIKRMCLICEKEFYIHQYRKMGGTGKYCSMKCYGVSKKGKNCYLWKGGISSINRLIRSSSKYQKWRKSVIKRDGGKCILCGSKTKVQAHHIRSFCNFPELRFDINNGESLCFKCHRLTDNFGRFDIAVEDHFNRLLNK